MFIYALKTKKNFILQNSSRSRTRNLDRGRNEVPGLCESSAGVGDSRADGSTCSGGRGRWGFPAAPPGVRDHGSGVEPRRGLFTQLWGSGSRGRRGCVQGLINHGCLGRDKQSRPSGEAPGWGGRGVVRPGTRALGGQPMSPAAWSTSARLHKLVNPHSGSRHSRPDADGAPEASARSRGSAR